MPDLETIINTCHGTAVEKGWHDNANHPRTVGDFIALCHSELSEALEEHRNGHDQTEVYYNPEKPDKPEGVPVELADVLIRIFDWCSEYNIPIEDALYLKMAFNHTRPVRHGGKVI